MECSLNSCVASNLASGVNHTTLSIPGVLCPLFGSVVSHTALALFVRIH